MANILIGILEIAVTVVLGFILIAIAIWLLGLVGFGLPADIVKYLRLLVVLVAIIQGVRLLLGAPRWYFRQ